MRNKSQIGQEKTVTDSNNSDKGVKNENEGPIELIIDNKNL